MNLYIKRFAFGDRLIDGIENIIVKDDDNIEEIVKSLAVEEKNIPRAIYCYYTENGPKTYTRGELMTIKEVINIDETKYNYEYFSLHCLLKELGIEDRIDNLSAEELNKKIIFIPGKNNRRGFFRNFDSNDMLKTLVI